MTDREELISYWLTGAEADLKVVEHLYEKEDYHYCLFLGHLVLEKMLKALYVKNIDHDPPYKHSLPVLAEKANLILTDEQEKFLEEVTNFNIEARYPDVKFKFYKKCNKEFTTKYYNKIVEYYLWLKSLI